MGNKVLDTFTGSSKRIIQFPSLREGLVLENTAEEGGLDLVFLVSGTRITVAPGETFQGVFRSFSEFAVLSEAPYRGYSFVK